MKILLATAFALTAIAATSAQAQTAPTAKVFYGDLSLNTAAGQATLKNRIVTTARRLCNSSERQDLGSRADAIRCFRDAVSGAMAHVPAPPAQFASR